MLSKAPQEISTNSNAELQLSDVVKELVTPALPKDYDVKLHVRDIRAATALSLEMFDDNRSDSPRTFLNDGATMLVQNKLQLPVPVL